MNVIDMINYAGNNMSPDVTVLSKNVEDGCIIEEQLVYVDILPGKRVKLYLWKAKPINIKKSVAGLVHIHGGTQTAYREHALFWAKRNYVCISYDWTGEYDGRKKYSDLGNLPSGEMNVEFDPEKSVLLTRLLVAKAVVTLLVEDNDVDKRRVGVYGVSWGGTITWLLNSYDNRLRAVCAIYGCGDHTLPGRTTNKGAIKDVLAESRWRDILDPSKRASHQIAPIFMIQSTNDFWGWMDTTTRNLGEMSDEKFNCSFVPNHDHHLDQYSLPSLCQWFETKLKQQSGWVYNPKISISSKENGLNAYVNVDSKYQIRSISLYYSLQDYHEKHAPARFWDELDVSQHKGEFSCRIPVEFDDEMIVMFATVIYENGTKVSSLPINFIPSYLGLKVSSNLESKQLISEIDNRNDGWSCMLREADPIIAYPFRYRIIPLNPNFNGLTYNAQRMFSMSTLKIGDLRWRQYSNDASLEILLYGIGNHAFTIKVTKNVSQQNEKVWLKRVDPFDDWKTIRLKLSDFTDENSKSPMCWSAIDMLTIECEVSEDSIPMIGKMEWKKKEYKSGMMKNE